MVFCVNGGESAEIASSLRQRVLTAGVAQVCWDVDDIDKELDETEQLTICSDRRSGLRAVIAIDDSTLGPGLGGVRWQAYPNELAAVDEARRLARVMTLKNACADLPYGGAKSVILKGDSVPPDGPRRRQAQLEAFGRFVARLGGAYIPGVDMGTSVEDLAVIGRGPADVACDHEDPSPWTALGVLAGIRAALSSVGDSLPGACGRPGCRTCRRRPGPTAGRRRVPRLVADVDEMRAGVVAGRGRPSRGTGAAMTTECDVFAPCAAAESSTGRPWTACGVPSSPAVRTMCWPLPTSHRRSPSGHRLRTGLRDQRRWGHPHPRAASRVGARTNSGGRCSPSATGSTPSWPNPSGRG